MPEIHERWNTPSTRSTRPTRTRRLRLLIAILALFLSFSETLGKSAQTEAIDFNVKSADTWAFFQAKDIRRTRCQRGRRGRRRCSAPA